MIQPTTIIRSRTMIKILIIIIIAAATFTIELVSFSKLDLDYSF